MSVFKKRYSFLLLVLCLFQSLNTSAQKEKYTYQVYKNERALWVKTARLIEKQNFDSAQIFLNQYHNRLGHTYYNLQAQILSGQKNPLYKTFLDSAFRKGMTPQCLGKQKRQFDSTYVWQSYSRNYLKAYDIALINSLDSMKTLDQKYRLQMMTPEKTKNYKQFKKPESAKDGSVVTVEDLKEKQRVDSLWKLQLPIDSTNQAFLQNVIKTKGWPSSKLIGRNYCTRMAPDPWLIIVHISDLTKNRETQTAVLKTLIKLCEKNEEDWEAAEGYMWSIHNRSRKEFHEFSFIAVNHNVLDKVASYFSMNQMAESVVKNRNERMEIKCKNYALFEQMRDYLVELGANVNLEGLNHIYKMEGWPLPKHPTKEDFVYVPAPEFFENQVQFRFIPL